MSNTPPRIQMNFTLHIKGKEIGFNGKLVFVLGSMTILNFFQDVFAGLIRLALN